jgi:hypothetical protein
MLPGGKTTKPSTFTGRTARAFLVAKAFVMRKLIAPDLDCLAAHRVYPSKRTVGKEIRHCTSHGREELPKILVDQSWLRRCPMALSDQLATQAVPSGRARGVQARSSHPEMTGHHRNTLGCAEHFLPGVRRYGDGRTTVRDTIIMIVHVLGKRRSCACYGCLSAWRCLSSVPCVRTHCARSIMYCLRACSSYSYGEVSRWWWVGPS